MPETHEIRQSRFAKSRERLIVALDVPGLTEAEALVRQLSGLVTTYKIGMELYNTVGPAAIEMVHRHGGRVFLDLKFHDIPNTVARAAAAVTSHGVFMFNVHAAGGSAMMQGAAEAAAERAAQLGIERPRVVAVTVLTSMNQERLSQEVGIQDLLAQTVLRWGRLAQESGLDGVVASAHEVSGLKLACGAGFLTVIPGVRPAGLDWGDQQRVVTPAQALGQGSDFLVVGRPINQASDPLAAAEQILSEMEEAIADAD